MSKVSGGLASWWRRNVIVEDPAPDVSRLDRLDGVGSLLHEPAPSRAEARAILTSGDELTDEQIDRLCRVLAAEVRAGIAAHDAGETGPERVRTP